MCFTSDHFNNGIEKIISIRLTQGVCSSCKQFSRQFQFNTQYFIFRRIATRFFDFISAGGKSN